MRRRQHSSRKGRHYIFWTSYMLLALGCAVAGGVVGLVFGYAVDLPRVEELQENQPNLVSYVFSADGRVLGQFASEKRMMVSYEQIPERLRQAILAAEDVNFFKHPGIDFGRLLVTIFRDLFYGETKGASTLTMQLSKMRFTSTEVTLERKIKDFLYAIDIEKSYSKEQIFTFYVNQLHIGHGRYGIAAGADFFFHKTLDELTTAECALLAGIIQTPARQSPILNPARALARRNWVLGRMLDVGFIQPDEYRSALEEPLEVKGRDDEETPAPYFVESVRQYLYSRYSHDQIWEGGLRVQTTLDYDMQVAAQEALREGLRAFDRRTRGWAGPVQNLGDQVDLEEYWHPDWVRLFYEGQMVPGVVVESDADSATVRLGNFRTVITPREIEWTRRKRVSDVLKRGDVAMFTLLSVNRRDRTIDVVLDQIPEVQGAAIILDNRTGAVRAMVGGFDFQYSQFNRAIQALRQPGSVFKPFTYVAAIEAGFSPNDTVLDGPTTFFDALGRPYEPTNWDDDYKGLIPIRQALAESRNVPTVRLANTLGPHRVAEVARRFGLRQEFPPYLSISLGAVEVTLAEIVSAFSCFPNHGVRAAPYFVERVEDYNGVLLEEHRGQVFDAVVSPEVADKMIYLMREVVRAGSGRSLLELGHPMGGKTGTTNDSTDVWYVGFTQRLSAGVWVGYDEKKSLGRRIFGQNLALPIWKEMMTQVLEGMPPEEFESSWTPGTEASARRIEESDESEEGLRKPQDSPVRQRFEVEEIPPPPPSLR